MTKITYIPGEIANAAIDEHGNRKPVTRAHHIFDDNKNKNQAEINVDIDNSLNQLSNEIDAVNKQDIISVDTLPDVATADPKKIYRVVGDNSYTDYMVNSNGDNWKKLATYSFPGIDNEPTAGSDNLVKSGGVFSLINTETIRAIAEEEKLQEKILSKAGGIKTIPANTELTYGEIEVNSYYRPNGEIVHGSSGTYYRSEPILIEGGKTFNVRIKPVIETNVASLWLDKDKNVISVIWDETLDHGVYSVTAPENAAYMCLTNTWGDTSVNCTEDITIVIDPIFVEKSNYNKDLAEKADKIDLEENVYSKIAKDVPILSGGEIMLDKTYEEHSYWKIDGSIMSGSSAYIYRFNPCKIIGGKVYNIKAKFAGEGLPCCLWLRKDGIVISKIFDSDATEITIVKVEAPHDAAYICLSSYWHDVSVTCDEDIIIEGESIFLKKSEVPDILDEVDKKYASIIKSIPPLYGKKIAYFGDSLMAGLEVNYGYNDESSQDPRNVIGGFWKRIKDKYNTDNVDNLSQGGTCLLADSSTDTSSICYKMTKYDANKVDIVLFTGGYNDSFKETEIGEVSNITSVYNFNVYTNICKAVEKAIHHLQSSNPNIKIVWIKCWNTGPGIATLGRLTNIYDAVEKCCNKWGVPVCDLYKNGNINLVTSSSIFGRRNIAEDGTESRDHTHLSTEGYDREFEYLDKFLNSVL